MKPQSTTSVNSRASASTVSRSQATSSSVSSASCLLNGPSITFGVPRSERRPPVLECMVDHSMPRISFRDCCSNAWTCFRSSIACLANTPCFRAFWFCFGAPEPGAPPCIRQRFLPDTAGDRQGPPERVLAPQRGLASIGPVLRGWPIINSTSRREWPQAKRQIYPRA
jgi:hypothetical protein